MEPRVETLKSIYKSIWSYSSGRSYMAFDVTYEYVSEKVSKYTKDC